MDSLRASAMLLGVLFHAIIMNGGTFGMPGTNFTDWSHSFRMSLFFLISGFFSQMMLEKYGLFKFLLKRWWKIGAPMLVTLYTLGLLHAYQAPVNNGGFANWLLRAKKPPPTFWERTFGRVDQFLMLNHLWFLWYLLVFATVMAGISLLIRAIVRGRFAESARNIGSMLARFHCIPLIVGIITLEPLMKTIRVMGWNLGPAAGVFTRFPKGLLIFQKDWPYYFLFFLAGWWLYRMRSTLSDFKKQWATNLAIGTASYVAGAIISKDFAFQTELPDYALIRLESYLLYGIGAAYTIFGFIGFFHRFANRRTAVGSYLAETALWVYLVHLELLNYVLRWVRPMKASWWVSGLASTLITTAIALVLFELFVRPTPLRHLFGSSQTKTPRWIKRLFRRDAGNLDPAGPAIAAQG